MGSYEAKAMMVERPVVREANTGQTREIPNAYIHIMLDAPETMLHIHHVHLPCSMGRPN